jgi:predicted RNA-binding Zn-ribbon protein involved in translation (DUF1610 family)
MTQKFNGKTSVLPLKIQKISPNALDDNQKEIERMIHAIVTTWALDEAKKRDALSHRCPKCGREERIASEKRQDEPVFCENCGTEFSQSETADREAKMREPDNK